VISLLKNSLVIFLQLTNLISNRRMSKAIKREYLCGITPCLAAIRAGRRKIFKLYLHDKFQQEAPQRDQLIQLIEESKGQNINVKYKSRNLLDRFSDKRPHQNAVLLTGKLQHEKLSKNLTPTRTDEVWLALDQIHDPMNFGAIIRSASYFGVDKIIVTENNCCGLTPTVSKASSGAMEWMPIHATKSLEKMLKDAVREGWDVIGTVKPGDESVGNITCSQDVTLQKPSIIVIGNEGFGLTPSVSDICNNFITINSSPHKMLPPGLDSLNVSVATGVLLHSLLKSKSIDNINTSADRKCST